MEDGRLTNLRADFARLAIEWAKAEVPYQHRGTNRQGCDCTGILIGIAREMGFLKNYKLRKYPSDWNLHAGAGNQVIEEISKFGHEINQSQSGIGDIAVMRFGKCPAHCGIIVNENLIMVHCLKTNKRVKFDILKNSMWSSRWLTTYRPDENKLNEYS